MLRSELRALRNTIRTKDGRQALVGAAIVLLCLAVGGLSLGSILTQDAYLEPLQDPATGLLGAACGALLVMPAFLVMAFAKIPSRAQLFEGSHVPAWLASPAGAGRIMATVWLRQTAFAFVSTCAIAAVPLVAMVVRADLPTVVVPAFLWLLLLTCAAAAAVILMVVVLTTRFGSSPRRRRVLLVVHLTLILAGMLLLLSGMTRGERVREWLLELAPGESAIGATLLEAGALPVALAMGEFSLAALGSTLVLLVVALSSLALAAAFYRRAFEAQLCATDAALSQQSGAWPQSAVRSLVRRGFLEAWRARGNLVLVALFGAFVVWRIADRPFVPLVDDPVPLIRELFFLQSGWLMLASILSMLLFLGVIGDEQKQLPLLATSPLPRRDLLRSRELLLGWPLLLTVVLATIAGKMVGGVGWSACLLYFACACPLALILLGAALAVGSWPTFIQLQGNVPLASNVRSVVPVLVLSVIAGVLLYTQHQVRRDLLVRGAANEDWLLAGLLALALLWAIAAATYALSTKVALRNLERLLGPQ